MLTGTDLRNPILINSIGHTAGVLLFGLILVLLIRDRRAYGMRRTRLSVVAAMLAFLWNVGSLVSLASHSELQPIGVVLTISFSLLSLLPAVLLHVALQGRQVGLIAVGYLVSSSAIILHFNQLFEAGGVKFHQAALILIAIGFGLLTVVAFLWGNYHRPAKNLGGVPEWVSLTCLFLFTSSFLHFSHQHNSAPWASEVTWHHIGIPVALIVLLQDYRFLLLDAFLRFLMNFGLAAVYIGALISVNERFRLWAEMQASTVFTGVCLVMLCVSLIFFAAVRNRLQLWMGRVIFRRRSIEGPAKVILEFTPAASSEEDLLTHAAKTVARHLRTDRYAVSHSEASTHRMEAPSIRFLESISAEAAVTEVFSVQAQIPLRFSSGDVRFLILGARRGGRRYLSEDLDDMRGLGAVIVEQVERFRAEELKRLAAQAELRALQAQINPHFLFNALNTLYGTIDRHSVEARRMVLNLADIFRYVLQSDRAEIQLSEELKIVQAYLEIEALRLGERLKTEVFVEDGARSVLIPVLSIQPLVENAVKHGISGKSGGGTVVLRAERNEAGLLITVADTGIGFEASSQRRRDGASVGLENVKRRLVLCHGPTAELEIVSDSNGTKVTFQLPTPVQSEQPHIADFAS
jgi:two-component system, LytTR family, sensor kinase